MLNWLALLLWPGRSDAPLIVEGHSLGGQSSSYSTLSGTTASYATLSGTPRSGPKLSGIVYSNPA